MNFERKLDETLRMMKKLVTESDENPLKQALQDLVKAKVPIIWALGGGLLASHYSTHRATEDVDIFILSDAELVEFTNLPNFKKIRPHALEHLPTGVVVEIISPEFVKGDPILFKRVLTDRIFDGDIPILTPGGLVAMKLMRGSHRDKDDILRILRKHEIDLSDYPLTKKQAELLDNLRTELSQEDH